MGTEEVTEGKCTTCDGTGNIKKDSTKRKPCTDGSKCNHCSGTGLLRNWRSIFDVTSGSCMKSLPAPLQKLRGSISAFNTKWCVGCKRLKPRDAFSKKQLKQLHKKKNKSKTNVRLKCSDCLS